ncbi:ATP-binding protein [Clostridium sartagoforme]|uniref:ATP-binding protein n=2 Tax=Clostridium sartagoforme TaxID=84031 RepID=A0A4S2DHT2_9CLOT|nr:GHKL domain-containing protein [Clostridium sp.]MBS5939080.1 GHKL domain-containing protein [Clostridium sp.]TGY41677.1 ATP-binding protein [Clostridium sartagoforme]
MSYLLSFLSSYIVFDFMSKIDRNKFYKRKVYIASYIIFTLALIILYGITGSEVLNVIFSLILTVIVGHFLYNDQKVYILYYSLLIVVLTIFQIVISYIFNLIYIMGIINFYDINALSLAISIVIQFASLIASRLFVNWYKQKSITNFTKVQFFNFLVLPIFSILYIVTLMMYMETFVSTTDNLLLIFNITSIIFLNIFITNIFQEISKKNEMKNKINLYENQANMEYEYYNSLEEKYKESRKVIHDIKNHIQTIENLYKDNEFDKAELYKGDLYKMFNKLEQKYYTYNKVLNIILNDKCEKAKRYGITIDCKIGDVNLEKIRDIDVTTIFSNLLDNAIDEVKEFKQDKEIFVKVDKFNEFIVINVTNKLKSKIVKIDSELKTTKKNHEGLGLQNVKMAIEKYEGTLRIDFDDNHFKVNIVIPTN